MMQLQWRTKGWHGIDHSVTGMMGVTALVSDDEKVFVEMFALRLEGQGEKVSTTLSGTKA